MSAVGIILVVLTVMAFPMVMLSLMITGQILMVMDLVVNLDLVMP